jgi:hypothetical protein
MIGPSKTHWSSINHALEAENSDNLSEFFCSGAWLGGSEIHVRA